MFGLYALYEQQNAYNCPDINEIEIKIDNDKLALIEIGEEFNLSEIINRDSKKANMMISNYDAAVNQDGKPRMKNNLKQLLAKADGLFKAKRYDEAQSVYIKANNENDGEYISVDAFLGEFKCEVHCVSLKQAKYLQQRLKERFVSFGLELNLEKTRIVYCKDDERTGNHEYTSFDFLGYAIRSDRDMQRINMESSSQIFYQQWEKRQRNPYEKKSEGGSCS